MSLDISSIINVTTRISAAGLSNANFGSAVIFAEHSEKPESVNEKSMNFYSSLSDLGEVYPSTTEVYKAATAWFATAPNPGSASGSLPPSHPSERRTERSPASWRCRRISPIGSGWRRNCTRQRKKPRPPRRQRARSWPT